MKRVRIVTDSTADLPKELAAKYDVAVVPLKVIFNGEELLRDGVDIETDEFYRRQVENGDLSTTTPPTPAEFAMTYIDLVESGHSIISIHISSAMSDTCKSAQTAKEMVSSMVSGRVSRLDIEIIDSRVTSMGLGLIVLEAARQAAEGKSKDSIVKSITEMIDNIQMYFVVDTLEYLARGGRIGKAQAFLGTLFNIKPLLCLKDGLVQPLEKVRGKDRAIERMAQIAEKLAGAKKMKCSLIHGMDPAGLTKLRQKITSRLNCEEPVVSRLGAVVGTHVGPRVVGVILMPE